MSVLLTRKAVLQGAMETTYNVAAVVGCFGGARPGSAGARANAGRSRSAPAAITVADPNCTKLLRFMRSSSQLQTPTLFFRLAEAPSGFHPSFTSFPSKA